MKIRMKLLSDTIFGNGMSIPGDEDISVLRDEQGFPYYKGSTFKGIFREEMERCLRWSGKSSKEVDETLDKLLGKADMDERGDQGKLVFSDFQMDAGLRELVRKQGLLQEDVLESLTHKRTFTKIDESGMVEEGSLRSCRCVDKGLSFFSEIQCPPGTKALVREVLPLIKWVGSMRSRGFGKVRISVEEEREAS